MNGLFDLLKAARWPGLLMASAMLWAGCAATHPDDRAEPPQRITTPFHSIALLPVQFVDNRPFGGCHEDIGDDLRSALARELRRRGYEVSTVPDRSSNSFAPGSPTPAPGTVPGVLQGAPAGTDTAMGLWVEDYLATTLCEIKEPKYLEMGVVAVLYALPEQRELGRWRAKEWDSGLGSSNDTVWWVTMELAEDLLAGIP